MVVLGVTVVELLMVFLVHLVVHVVQGVQGVLRSLLDWSILVLKEVLHVRIVFHACESTLGHVLQACIKVVLQWFLP